jgi:hypothetical protein
VTKVIGISQPLIRRRGYRNQVHWNAQLDMESTVVLFVHTLYQ